MIIPTMPFKYCKLPANWQTRFIYSPKQFLLSLALEGVNVGPCEQSGLQRFDCKPKMTIMIPNVCYYCTKETRWKVCVGSRLIFEIGSNSQSHVWNGTPTKPKSTCQTSSERIWQWIYTLWQTHGRHWGIRSISNSADACSSCRSPAPSFTKVSFGLILSFWSIDGQIDGDTRVYMQFSKLFSIGLWSPSLLLYLSDTAIV